MQYNPVWSQEPLNQLLVVISKYYILKLQIDLVKNTKPIIYIYIERERERKRENPFCNSYAFIFKQI